MRKTRNLVSNMASSQEGFANFEKFEVNGKAVTKLKVDELKNELKARGLEKTGLKKELVERLCKALEKENNSAELTGSPEEKPSPNNDEKAVEEVLSTMASQDVNDKNSNDMDSNDKDSNEQNGAEISEDKKDKTETYEDNTGNEENKYEKKSSEANSLENKNNGKETEELEDGEITGQDDEKKENQKTVPEKRRRISLTRQTSNNPPTPGTRKRKWSSNKPKSSVVISTDSLKGLIPGVQLASTPALEAVMELDDDKEDEEMAEVKEEKQEDKKERETEKTNNKHDEKSAYKRRIVQVADSKTVKLGEIAKEECAKDKNEVIVIDADDIPAGTGSHDDNQSSATPPSSETATPVKREISPPRNPPSCAIHVANLVRPFTQKQLFQHLSEFGAVSEEDFWINKIKSHCYVIYQSIKDATYARQSMHGQRWPSTSPRFLRVDFADNEKMLEDTDGALGKKVESTEQKKENVEESKERSKERSTRKHKDKKEEKKKDEPSAAANLLDKLFRKTTTTPCIYWLPLTNEQIATREKEREERRKQRQLALQQEQKQVEPPHQEERKAQGIKKEKPRENVRGKERDISRDQDRRPQRDNRVSSPPSRQRPDRRSSPVKRRSRSPAFRRSVPNRRR